MGCIPSSVAERPTHTACARCWEKTRRLDEAGSTIAGLRSRVEQLESINDRFAAQIREQGGSLTALRCERTEQVLSCKEHGEANDREVDALRAQIKALEDLRLMGALPSMICPISQGLMADPVRASDGTVYDRASIEAWLATGSRTSPITRRPITDRLTPLHSLRKVIEEYAAAFPSEERLSAFKLEHY
jgi:hypothetical protein